MGAHMFCPKCGHKNDYINGAKPNFCSGCGFNINSIEIFASKNTSTAPTGRRKMDVEIDYSNSSGRDAQQNIKAEDLGVDVGYLNKDANKLKMGDVLFSQAGGMGARQSLNTKLNRKIDTKQTYSQYQKEAGYREQPNVIDIGNNG